MHDLPDFTNDGVLPSGDYKMTLDALEESAIVLGPGQPSEYPVWDASWRQATRPEPPSHGQSLEFPAYFRKCRSSGEPKGIIRVVR